MVCICLSVILDIPVGIAGQELIYFSRLFIHLTQGRHRIADWWSRIIKVADKATFYRYSGWDGEGEDISLYKTKLPETASVSYRKYILVYAVPGRVFPEFQKFGRINGT
jgi:hypothetical protein